MNYHVARGGQTYGPYSEETIRKYLSEGSIQAADMARTDAMPNWVPLGQLLGGLQMAAQAPVSAPPPQAYAAPVFIPPGSPQPQQYRPAGGVVPPSMHWAIVLVLGVITGIFVIIWLFVQANFVKTIDPSSRAIRDLAISVIIHFAGWIAFIMLLVVGGVSSGLGGMSSGDASHIGAALIGAIGLAFLVLIAVSVIAFIFAIKGIFGMRTSIERYYNTTEPINLRLSQVMTFFFSVFYFQYHFTRIADWKRSGVLQP